jgi:hypothetical protein
MPISVGQTCLNIPEIGRRVASHMPTWSTVAIRERRLLNLGLTCRALLEPALEEKWSRVYGIETLAKELPRETWDRGDSEFGADDGDSQSEVRQCLWKTPERHLILAPLQFFLRPPLESEWCRLLRSARRVRTLVVFGGSGLSEAQGLDILRILALYRPRTVTSILPHLRTLEWDEYGERSVSCLDYIQLFLEPSLFSLSISYADMAWHPFVVFERVRTVCNGLRELEMTSESLGPVLPALGTLITSLHHLRILSLDCEGISAETFGHLAELSSLHELKVVWPSVEDTGLAFIARLRDHDRSFAALQTLHVNLLETKTQAPSRRITSLGAFLGAISGPLVEFNLNSFAINRYSLHTLALSLITHLALRIVRLQFGGDSAGKPDNVVADFTIDSGKLKPLRALSALTTLEIHSPFLALESAGLRELVNGWPQIENIILRLTCVRTVHRPVTKTAPCLPFGLDDLAHISACCPRLFRLEIPLFVDLKLLPLRERVAQPQRRLKHLVLICAHVMPDSFARFASAMNTLFPTLTGVQVDFPDLLGPGVTPEVEKLYEAEMRKQGAVFRNISLAMKEFSTLHAHYESMYGP